MKKSLKMLVKGISLALSLSLVLSVGAFAEKVTNTYTPTQSDGKTVATQYTGDESGLYYMVSGGSTTIVPTKS
ncbi:MAG: hypothetical protein U0L92_04395 [Clostridia bacterium]|nr:hypothetical protein [Clostridia bacterium]